MTYSKAGRILLLLLILTGSALTLIYRAHIDEAAVDRWLSLHPVTSPLLFLAFYLVMTILFFPGSMLSIIGGALFGPFWGTFYNQLFATTGAALTFIISRFLSEQWLEKHLSVKMKKIKRGVEDEGWRFVLLVRLFPGIPFSALNYALGMTRVRLLHFVVITFICIFPRVVAYSYVGHIGRKSLSGGEMHANLPLALLLLAFVVFAPYLTVSIWKSVKGKI